MVLKMGIKNGDTIYIYLFFLSQKLLEQTELLERLGR